MFERDEERENTWHKNTHRNAALRVLHVKNCNVCILMLFGSRERARLRILASWRTRIKDLVIEFEKNSYGTCSLDHKQSHNQQILVIDKTLKERRVTELEEELNR